MSLHPIRTSEAIAEGYYGYLETTFELANANLRNQFRSELRKTGRFVSGPFVQVTPPFKTGVTLAELVSEGILSPLFHRYPDETLERPLYKHQEDAIRKMISGERNLVVATGTGSGKTECFLIPICNYLLREYEAGTLSPGVRALLLYPMNALANDQVKRLRDLFEPFEFITFGRYTGETQEGESAALELYRNTFQYDPLPNELISRERMRLTPPNVLITNYSMLEYLLLRPKDNAFFDGEDAHSWKFVVLDEAHTYSGVKGIETAMLLRRVKDRVFGEGTGKFQCVATSATLGKGIDDAEEIMEFATRLFSETFTYDAQDSMCQDLVVAEREPIDYAATWGRPDPKLYLEWTAILASMDKGALAGDKVIDKLAEIGAACGLPGSVLARAQREAKDVADAFLFVALSGDENMVLMQTLLEDNPLTIVGLAEDLFGDSMVEDLAEELLVSLVGLAVRARLSPKSNPLLPARYHLILRALSGVWFSCAPEPIIHLDYVDKVPYLDGHGMAYQLGVCQTCRIPYLSGRNEVAEDGFARRLSPASYNEPGARYYAIYDFEKNVDGLDNNGVDEDEGPLTDEHRGQAYKLCPICGQLQNIDGLGVGCDCGVEKLIVIDTRARGKMVGRCVICGAANTRFGIVRNMSAQPEAASSVIATALYQELHDDENSPLGPAEPQQLVAATGDSDSDWGDDAGDRGDNDPRVGLEGKKILVFSDSRQDAAYFAPYMQDTYDRLLRRNVILASAREAVETQPDLSLSVAELWEQVWQELKPILREQGLTDRSALTEAQTGVLNEFTRRGRYALETLGLLGFQLQRPSRWQPPRFFERRMGLTESEVWDLYHILLGTLRRSGAIGVPDGVDRDHEIFEPGNLRRSIRQSTPLSKENIMAWVPTATNGRSDYLEKLITRLGLCVDARDFARDVLGQMWEKEFKPHAAEGLWSGYFALAEGQRSISYRLVPERWQVLAAGSCRTPNWYACDQCGSLTQHSVRGVCPEYRCPGTLASIDILERLEKNHYVRLYAEPDLPRKMLAKEHTAQLTPEAAARSQTEFQHGRINILSCSTTFELGVDLGDLEAVFMKNVPPSPANYVQRAGRAGRRASTAAMVVTYAQNRPHDVFHYRYPERMIKGHIRPPHFELNNEKIVLRHIYAVALAEFWRDHEDYIENVESFFFRDGTSGVDDLAEYLAGKPSVVARRLRRVVPDELGQQLGIDSWGWVDTFLAPLDAREPGPLTVARKEVEADVDALQERYRELAERYDHINIGRIGSLMNTIKKRPLINFLSGRNVLPRYGFPVDVVNLDLRLNRYADGDIELQRELKLAVSEYAPDSQVVAGGKIWTSRYLQFLPQRHWPRYLHGECANCKNHVTKLYVGDDVKEILCDICSAPVQCSVFVVPEFGFLADTGRPIDAGSRGLERAWASRVFFSGIETTAESRGGDFYMAGGLVKARTSKQGKLAVVNTAGGREYMVCSVCGYAGVVGNPSSKSGAHKNTYGKNCRGRLERVGLGHEFMSDIARIEFEPANEQDPEFWYSLLYAVMEGACMALDIHRTEIDGCVQWGTDLGLPTSLVLFDSVAGGVGHVQRLGVESDLRDALEAAYLRMDACTCGSTAGGSSCYGCLRSYSNQFCHDLLNREVARDFLKELLVGEASARSVRVV